MPLVKPTIGETNWGGKLNTALDYLDTNKQPVLAGTTNQYVKGNGTLGTFASASWSPTFTDSTGTLAGVTQTGNYTQIGKMVFFCVNVDFNGYTNLGTGQYQFNLPLPPRQTFTSRGGTLHNVSTDSRYHIAAITDIITDGANAKAKLYYSGSTTDLAWKYNTPVSWASNTTHFDISGFYEIA
jgi:hypothetical protein